MSPLLDLSSQSSPSRPSISSCLFSKSRSRASRSTRPIGKSRSEATSASFFSHSAETFPRVASYMAGALCPIKTLPARLGREWMTGGCRQQLGGVATRRLQIFRSGARRASKKKLETSLTQVGPPSPISVAWPIRRECQPSLHCFHGTCGRIPWQRVQRFSPHSHSVWPWLVAHPCTSFASIQRRTHPHLQPSRLRPQDHSRATWPRRQWRRLV